MTTLDDARVSLVLGVERFALIARNFALVLIAGMFLTGHLRGNQLGLVVVGVLVMLHTALSLWVFYSERYAYFSSIWNFALNLAEITLAVAFTGGINSVLYVLFLFFLMAFSAYTRSLRTVAVATGLCLICFGGLALIEAPHPRTDLGVGVVMFKFVAIAVCGWMVGAVSKVLGHTEDVSLAREQALASSEATMRTILDSAADPIFVYDEQEFVVEANDRACKFLAVPRCKLLGQRIRTFLFDDGTLPTKMANLRARGEYRGEQIFLSSYGEERTVDLRVRSYIRDGARFFVAVGPDITEQKNLQEATRMANIHLEKLNQELKQVNELRRGFLTTISQKLRSPLAAILGYVEMMLDEELGDITSEQRRALTTCRRGALRAFDLIDEALSFGHGKRESKGGVASSEPSSDPASSTSSPPPRA